MKREANAASKLQYLAIATLASSQLAFGQQSAPKRKVLTPEQRQFQAEVAQWMRQRSSLRAQAQAALDAEMAREKASDCPNADSTRAAEQCLATEIEKTQANHATLANSIRAMLALAYPTMPGEQPVSGPTGTPPSASDRVAEFDRLEAESKRYRELGVQAAYNEFKGGTEAPVFASEAEQRLLRLHLQELAFIYDTELSNR